MEVFPSMNHINDGTRSYFLPIEWTWLATESATNITVGELIQGIEERKKSKMSFIHGLTFQRIEVLSYASNTDNW